MRLAWLVVLAAAPSGAPEAGAGGSCGGGQCDADDVSALALRQNVTRGAGRRRTDCGVPGPGPPGQMCLPCGSSLAGATCVLSTGKTEYPYNDIHNDSCRPDRGSVPCQNPSRRRRGALHSTCALACEPGGGEARDPPQPSPRGAGDIMYDDAVVIAQTGDAGNTQNCGWYGCRVAAMPLCYDQLVNGGPDCYPTPNYFSGNEATCVCSYGLGSPSMNPAMTFTHGSNIAGGNTNAMGFFFRRPVGSEQGARCVNYGDSVVIAFTGQDYFTSNCGWYGCRVAYLESHGATSLMRFGHGGDAPSAFSINPPADVERSGCVQYGDDVVIAQGFDAALMGSYAVSDGAPNPGGVMFFSLWTRQSTVLHLRPTPPSGA